MTTARVLERDRQGHVGRGGRVIIPAFAVGRVEELLYWLKRLEEEGRIPVLPVFVDSPMAIEALGALHRAAARARRGDAARAARRQGAARARGARGTSETPAPAAGAQRASALCVLHRALPHDRVAGRVEGADQLRRCRRSSSRRAAWRPAAGCCIICGRGAAGRAQHGAVRRLPGGTARAAAASWTADAVKIHGQIVPVHARIERIESMSAHADSQEILRWLGGFARPPRTTFIVHGEPPAMEALQASIKSKLGWATHDPGAPRNGGARLMACIG